MGHAVRVDTNADREKVTVTLITIAKEDLDVMRILAPNRLDSLRWTIVVTKRVSIRNLNETYL